MNAYDYVTGGGYNSPEVEHEIHPTSVKRDSPIVVNSPNTVYTEEHITAKFEYRGADVVKVADGRVEVTPTVKSFELRTTRKVQKTGCVSFFLQSITLC